MWRPGGGSAASENDLSLDHPACITPQIAHPSSYTPSRAELAGGTGGSPGHYVSYYYYYYYHHYHYYYYYYYYYYWFRASRGSGG